MSSSTIAVLGGGGFLGARLLEYARLAGEEHWLPVIRSPRSLARLSRLGTASWRKANAADVTSLAEAFAGCQTVVNVTLGDTHTMLAETETIWKACVAAKVRRLIHLSSAVVFDRVQDPATHDDSAPVADHWMYYARAKAACERFLQSQSGGPEVVILRPGLIWGPGSPWSHLPARQLDRGGMWLAQEGQGVCNLVHVDNLVKCIRMVAAAGGNPTGAYNVGDPGEITWHRYASGVAAALGYPAERVLTVPRGPLAFHRGLVVEWLKQQPWFYRSSKWALKRMSGEAKSRLKSLLPWLAGGTFQAPVPTDVKAAMSPPRFSREQWSLQSTERRLGMEKFVSVFGDPQLMSFEEGLARTARWLQFAGYGRRNHGQ
jgi:nucleoside-diphosphate-sugar epimerase